MLMYGLYVLLAFSAVCFYIFLVGYTLLGFLLLLNIDLVVLYDISLMQISFQPLVQCLDVDNFIKFFTAVLLERRILIRSHKCESDLKTI